MGTTIHQVSATFRIFDPVGLDTPAVGSPNNAFCVDRYPIVLESFVEVLAALIGDIHGSRQVVVVDGLPLLTSEISKMRTHGLDLIGVGIGGGRCVGVGPNRSRTANSQKGTEKQNCSTHSPQGKRQGNYLSHGVAMADVTLDPNAFGYLRDPDKKPDEKPDWSFTLDLAPKFKALATGDVDFREHCTTTHQKSLPACVGNSTADAVEVLSSLQGFPKVELSRLFVWTLARNLMDVDHDGKGDIDKKTGTYIRLAFEVISHFGICLEEYWPYDLTKWNVPPSILAMRKATGRKIKGYYRITETGKDRPDAILKALQAQHPVVFGTQIDQAFMDYKKGTLGVPTGPSLGGHAMVVVGFDSARGFIVKNSWGEDWGEDGFGYFAPEYLSWGKTWDIWVPTMGHNFI